MRGRKDDGSSVLKTKQTRHCCERTHPAYCLVETTQQPAMSPWPKDSALEACAPRNGEVILFSFAFKTGITQGGINHSLPNESISKLAPGSDSRTAQSMQPVSNSYPVATK